MTLKAYEDMNKLPTHINCKHCSVKLEVPEALFDWACPQDGCEAIMKHEDKGKADGAFSTHNPHLVVTPFLCLFATQRARSVTLLGRSRRQRNPRACSVARAKSSLWCR